MAQNKPGHSQIRSIGVIGEEYDRKMMSERDSGVWVEYNGTPY